MWVEQIQEIPDVIDSKLQKAEDMSLEISWIKEKCPNLSAKETFVATQLIENVCMWNNETKEMIIAFNEKKLLQARKVNNNEKI